MQLKTQTPKTEKLKIKWYWSIPLLVYGVWLLVKLFPGTPSDPNTSNGSMAMVVCEDQVKKYLKAPATAEFSGITETKIVAQGNRNYAVIGWVDSQNSFGAKLRTKYVCEATDEGSGNWSFKPLVTNDGD